MRLAGAFDVGRLRLASCWLLAATVGACGVVATAPSERVAPRYLVYPPAVGSATKVQFIFGLGIPMEVDVSTIVGYVIKCNYDLPYNASYLAEPYARHARWSYDGADSSAGPVDSPAGIQRAGIYQMIEAAISSGSQFEGKPCLLRAICEAAATPFDSRRSSVFAGLLHILLTPSSTAEPIDQQYLAAERTGGRAGGGGGECARAFAECRASFLEYFSEIH
ncbi:uncharacterized protein LOC131665065 [Phymastichus coffea]|uniref:uncharacterized protein LOC131665065 n=1 Tax=Phymastichus coffea TaxID=108790 RepID=UPI00273CA9AA|nr:uncharacterized protein LOC131665065 [Phymastichus coffea]